MRVPVEAVRRMRRWYRDAREMWRFANAAGVPGTEPEYARMWEGDFDGVELKVAEGFFWMAGYDMQLRSRKD